MSELLLKKKSPQKHIAFNKMSVPQRCSLEDVSLQIAVLKNVEGELHQRIWERIKKETIMYYMPCAL